MMLRAQPRLAACLLALAAVGCNRGTPPPGDAAAATDSAFARVQTRGAAVMGVDQYTSAHVFETLPDGGRVVLDRANAADSAGIATVRRHMREVADDFRRGDFSKPFAVHAQTVPGTGVMAERGASISYVVADRPAGAEVRIRTADSVAIAAVHAFLAFQRQDHRAAGHEAHAGHAPAPSSRAARRR